MKARWFLLIGSVLTVSIALSAQQPARTSPATAKGQRTTQALKQRCDEFLKPLREAPELDFWRTGNPVDAYNRKPGDEEAFNRREEALRQLSSRLEKDSDEALRDAELSTMQCATDLPDRRSRRDALDAYVEIIGEQERRVRANDLAASLEQQSAELKKQHDDFLEAAKFAAALYKERNSARSKTQDSLPSLTICWRATVPPTT